jgi:23S rRNA pseudouridine955/2504/2580 synthase
LNYLDVYPRTGRTHQIRVHLAAVGIPIVGDAVYGSSSLNAEARSRWGINRLFLHAYRLTFTHPATKQSFTIEAPLPVELDEALQHIRSARAT